VSTRNLSGADLVEFTEACLAQYNAKGRLLEVEVTEKYVDGRPQKCAFCVLIDLRSRYFLSVDDCGTGCLSLAGWKILPINTLKIDWAYTGQMVSSNQDEIIANSTIARSPRAALRSC
jgi:EAL domain-containing protein (putative c-di-GMP-specific phosphodiesterase class I)|tara:strand:- start:258 stop:611 length:354 start_codon:yes stop_codon:yes gene_type:complete